MKNIQHSHTVFYRNSIVSILLVVLHCGSFASIKDTVNLDEVTVVSQISHYQTGAKVESISQHTIETVSDGNLETLLSRFTAIPVKSNAGGLSTIRFRGTSPNHTSVNVGGINLNSLTLGHSNFSNIPVFLFEGVTLQYGSSSVINGSGSIGGSINLNTQNRWIDGVNADVKVSAGSFGEQFYGTKLYLGNGNLESATKVYYFHKKNNFTFLHPETKDFETGEMIQIKDTQRHASINNMGVMQELAYRFHRSEYIKLMVWLEDDAHEIQQNMSTNLNNPEYADSIEDKHIRIWTSYNNSRGLLNFNAGAGYVMDNSIYNNDTDSPIQTKRFIGESSVEVPVFGNGELNGGFKTEIISPNVYAYDINDVLQYQTDIYLSYVHTLYTRLKLSANIRKGFVTDFTVPFTPAVGVSYIAVSKENYALKFLGNVSKSYRVPTFNDRFWVPGGNPNLNPEEGVNYEVGSKISIYSQKTKINLSVNGFYMNVDNWILWKNKGAYWTAENVQNVESKGVEFAGKTEMSSAKSKTIMGINYSLNSVQRVTSDNMTAAIGRQMEYVPLHNGVFYASYVRNKIGASFDVAVKSFQYTNEEPYNIIDSYALANANVNYTFLFSDNQKLTTTLFVYNIFNVNYQSSWGYAMPRISYKISVAFKYK